MSRYYLLGCNLLTLNMYVCAAQALELPFTPAFLQPNASFTRGANFASAGSGLLDSTSAGKVRALSTDTNISLFLFHSLDQKKLMAPSLLCLNIINLIIAHHAR